MFSFHRSNFYHLSIINLISFSRTQSKYCLFEECISNNSETWGTFSGYGRIWYPWKDPRGNDNDARVCMLSCVWLCNSMGCSPPGSSVHGLFQTGILERIAISSSKYPPDPGIKPAYSIYLGGKLTANVASNDLKEAVAHPEQSWNAWASRRSNRGRDEICWNGYI